MVQRTFFAIDNESLVVTSSSSAVLVGNGIINNSSTPDGTIFIFNGGGGSSVTIDDTDTFADAIPDDNNLFFNDDDTVDHTVIDGNGLVANGTGVEAESTILLQALDSSGTPTGPVIELTVFSQNGVTEDVWGFATDVPLDSGTSYIKVGGDNEGTAPYADFAPCFEATTLIETRDGAKQVGDIAVGDMLLTQDHGYQPVRWVGRRLLSEMELKANPKLRPIRVTQGALGAGLPKRDLVVSRQHRMVVQSKIAQRMFGKIEVLVAAIKLTECPGVAVDDSSQTVEYVHLLFDQHEIIFAEGAPTESLFTGPGAMSAMSAEARREILTLFPEVSDLDYAPEPARQIPSGKQQKRLIERHRGNKKPLVGALADE